MRRYDVKLDSNEYTTIRVDEATFIALVATNTIRSSDEVTVIDGLWHLRARAMELYDAATMAKVESAFAQRYRSMRETIEIEE